MYKSLLQFKHNFCGDSKVDIAVKSFQSYNGNEPPVSLVLAITWSQNVAHTFYIVIGIEVAFLC